MLLWGYGSIQTNDTHIMRPIYKQDIKWPYTVNGSLTTTSHRNEHEPISHITFTSQFKFHGNYIKYSFKSIVTCCWPYLLIYIHCMAKYQADEMKPTRHRILPQDSKHWLPWNHHNSIWSAVNSMRPRQNGRHFADNTFNRIFVKILEFWLNLRWSLFLRVQLTIFLHWFR